MLRTDRCFKDPLSRDAHTWKTHKSEFKQQRLKLHKNSTKLNFNSYRMLKPQEEYKHGIIYFYNIQEAECCVFTSAFMCIRANLCVCLCCFYQLQRAVAVGQIQSFQTVWVTQETVQVLCRKHKHIKHLDKQTQHISLSPHWIWQKEGRCLSPAGRRLSASFPTGRGVWGWKRQLGWHREPDRGCSHLQETTNIYSWRK